MDKIEFQLKINNLLNKANTTNQDARQVIRIANKGVNLVLHFDGLDMRTLEWLNNRFHYGIHLIEGKNNVVYINSPLETKITLS